MLETLIFALILNLVGLTIAFLLKTDKLTDMSYSLTFIGITIFGIVRNDMNEVKWLISFVVFLWALRLGAYLVYRIHKTGRDKRFDDRRDSFIEFGKFWVLQALTAWVVMLPVSYLLMKSAFMRVEAGFTLGLIIAVTAIAYEAIADIQKYNFIQNKKNKGKWIETGLWKNSRHPNYFGEIVVWVGVYVACSIYLSGLQVWIGFLSPLLIIILLIFVSGIPLLEKSADKKWGKDKKYQEYKANTSILIPLPKK